MGRRVHAVDAEKDYVMAGIERLFIVSLRCEMKMKQAKVISISSAVFFTTLLSLLLWGGSPPKKAHLRR